MYVRLVEYACLQSALLQKGVPCETRQLPLGDMLWVARREDNPTSEVLLGYIVERKTASDLASSIVDGRCVQFCLEVQKYLKKMKRISCWIEDFVYCRAHLCKLCV